MLCEGVARRKGDREEKSVTFFSSVEKDLCYNLEKG